MNEKYEESKAEMFEDRMNDWLTIIKEKANRNNEGLVELIDKLFGEGIKEEQEQKPEDAIGFAGIAGTWLRILRDINDMLAENSRILGKIRKEFK